ncbi:MAG: hypothetical protein IKY92_09000 [Akkermansia sp.]|nr:hypothetical protein [Akkermansia sp.]
MSRITTISSVMALAMSPVLLANAPALRIMPANLVSVPGVTTAPAPTEGNCDLMAANTVRAGFIGLRDLAVQRVDQDAPSTVQVAVFQVLDSLGYRRFNRFGDGQLTPGTQFTIAMNRELPGQPSANVDTIASLQPGAEVIMRVDHLYLRTEQEGESIRACARLAMANSDTPAAPAAAPAPAPLPIPGAMPQQTPGMSLQMSSRSFSMTTDASGQMQTVQTSRVYDPATGQIKTRMLVNGVEVDPETRQPLATALAPVQQPEITPAPAPVSEQQAQQDAEEDDENDTIVEHNNNPIVQPGDKAPMPTDIAPIAEPAPTGVDTMSAGDSF